MWWTCGEYNAKNFNTLYKENGSVKQTTIIYTPKYNGVVERKNQTFVTSVQCMLQHMKLDHKFWAEIMATITYIHNWILTKTIFSMILEEVWCEYTLSKSHLCVFGCVTCVHVPKEARTKLDSKGVKCIFINYCEKTKGYRLYNPINQYVIINVMLSLMNPRTLMGKH